MFGYFTNSLYFCKQSITSKHWTMSEVEYNNMSSRQMEFAVFCVGCVAEALNRPATEVYDLLKNDGLLRDYIVEFYDVLHTQSREYIVEDIIRAMKERRILS